MTNICFILSFITIRVTPVNYNIHICPHYWTIYWTKTQCTMNINLVIIVSLFICWTFWCDYIVTKDKCDGWCMLFQEQEMEKQQLLSEQARLSERGAAEMVLLYISASRGRRWFYSIMLSLLETYSYTAFIMIYKLITTLTIVCRIIITSLIFNLPSLLTSI